MEKDRPPCKCVQVTVRGIENEAGCHHVSLTAFIFNGIGALTCFEYRMHDCIGESHMRTIVD